jgi:cofilin
LLPFTDCRFAVYDHEYTTADGRMASKLWFISWLPSNSTPYTKMAYTSAKTKFRESLPGVFDLQASNVEELEIGIGIKGKDEDEDDGDFDF